MGISSESLASLEKAKIQAIFAWINEKFPQLEPIIK